MIKNALALVVLLGACAAGTSAQATRPAPTTAPEESDVLAAESLVRSAVSVANSPDARARAGRLVALSEFANLLRPGDAQTTRLLAGIYETQGRIDRAIEAVETCLRAAPQDQGVGLEWLRLNTSNRQTADARVEFLQGVVAREDLPPALRASAASAWAGICVGQGETDQADRLYRQALRLDPLNPPALAGQLGLKTDASDADRALVQLRTLASMPRDIDTAVKLARLLDSMGLYDEAIALLDACEKLAAQHGEQPPHSLVVEQFSALLDAGQAARAIERFPPQLKRFGISVDLQSLMIEAYRATGQDAKADEIVQQMEVYYSGKEAATSASESFTRELAWFYLVTRRQPLNALKYAELAARFDAADPFTQRVLGIAELLNERPGGEDRLKKLMDTDLYAAAFLARHYFSQGDRAAGTKAVQAGAKIGRGGPAFRMLSELAAKNGVEISPVPGSAEMKAAFAKESPKILEMALAPEKFLAVTLAPARESFAPGEPIYVDARLANIGDVDVPLGVWGLLSPTISLEVRLAQDAKAAFVNLPLATWPAPRYLKPGQSVSTRIQLDVGRLERYLADHPLQDVSLIVTGMIDPIQRNTKFFSSVPTVAASPATVVRASLVEPFDASRDGAAQAAWNRALGIVVYYLRKGTLPQRMMAARQVGSLLAMARGQERGQIEVPSPFAKLVDKPVLLAMLKAALADRSPCVRAEALTALQGVSLDAGLLNLVAPAVDDRSSLVRFRAAELLGATGSDDHKSVLDYLANDSNEMVRLMAKALLEAK